MLKDRNNLISSLGSGYVTDNFTTLVLSSYGKITIEILKNYLLRSVFRYFKHPIYIDSPVIQDNLTVSREAIKLSEGSSLRHTFHHFYFKELEGKDLRKFSFPLQFIEQGLLFRNEVKKGSIPFLRQSAFTVTNLHSFCEDLAQAESEIESAFHCIRSFEKNLNIKFNVVCHIKKTSYVPVEFLEKTWGASFEKDYNSDEEAILALDFNLKVKDGEEYELTALEIYETKIGHKKRILVDFTIGGAERILYSICLKNRGLPVWLCPVQVIGLVEDIRKSNFVTDKMIRFIAVSDTTQLNVYRKKLDIPFVYDTKNLTYETIVEKIKELTPQELEQNVFKGEFLAKPDQLANYEIF